MTFKYRHRALIILLTIMLTSVASKDKECYLTKNIKGRCVVTQRCIMAVEELKAGRPHELPSCNSTTDIDPEKMLCCPSSYVITEGIIDRFKPESEKHMNNSRESCRINRFMTGICTVAYRCTIAMEQLGEGKPHKLPRCGFTDKLDTDEIVCCPITSIIQHVDNKGDSDRKNRTSIKNNKEYCKEISKLRKSLATFDILGGVNASEGEFPHMVGLLAEDSEGLTWPCDGAVISSKFILTAAHCFTSTREKITAVRVGVTRMDYPNTQDFEITDKDYIIHPDYDFGSKFNDIALIKIKEELKFDKTIYPACLYDNDNEPNELIITGWGPVGSGAGSRPSTTLQKANVTIMERNQCQQNYAEKSFGTRLLRNTQFCATSPPGNKIVDACRGDSGAPAQIKNNLGTYSIVGIVSYGHPCGGKTPGVYTKVSPYVKWIEKQVGVWTIKSLNEK